MNGLGSADRRTFSIAAAAAFLIGMGGLAFTLTILWLAMRIVLGIGGFCASGGPYVPRVPCPDEVLTLMPLSIFGMFIFGGLAVWGGIRLGGRWVALISLGWPALFLSLGWNFLEFGLWPPGGEPGEVVWAWLICAVVFGLMGGVPLVVALRGGALPSIIGRPAYGGTPVIIDTRGSADTWLAVQQALADAGITSSGLASLDLDRSAAPAGDTQTGAAAASARAGDAQAGDAPSVAAPGSPAPPSAAPDLATRLGQLASLHRAGDLTDAEFEAAKRATLDGAGR